MNNNIVNGVIQVLDQLKNSGQLNSYLIDDDERKWTKLVYDIMINKFDMPFGNSTMQQASEIFNNAVRVWKGKNKLGNMMNMESKTMNKKLIRLTEQDLHKIVKESVNRVLRENGRDIDDDNYFGGGLPDRYFDDDALDNDRISQKQIAQLDNIANTIADIANNTSDEAELLFQAADCIDKFTSRYK